MLRSLGISGLALLALQVAPKPNPIAPDPNSIRPIATGDTDGDGDTDTVDLTTAIINFTGARNAAAAVPEPSSLLLLLLAVGCLVAFE